MNQMTNNRLFDEILQETPADVAQFVDKSMDIADQIVAILKAKGWSQKKLADALGKKESEISKWLTGTHNFTLRSIAKMEAILKEDIIVAPMYWEEYKGMYAPAEATVKPIQLPAERIALHTKAVNESVPFYVNKETEKSELTIAAGVIKQGKHLTDIHSFSARASVEFYTVTESKIVQDDSQHISVSA